MPLIMADYYAYCSYGLFSLLMNLFIFNSTFFLGLLFVFVYICSGCLLFYVVVIVGETKWPFWMFYYLLCSGLFLDCVINWWIWSTFKDGWIPINLYLNLLKIKTSKPAILFASSGLCGLGCKV